MMTLLAAPVVNQGQVMIVDEFDEIASLVDALSKEDGFELVQVRSTPELMRALGVCRPDLVILDVGQVDRSTSKLIEFLRATYPSVSIVAVAEDRQAVLLAVKAGACFAIRKPFEYQELRNTLRMELAPR